jgi:hypothetical protein
MGNISGPWAATQPEEAIGFKALSAVEGHPESLTERSVESAEEFESTIKDDKWSSGFALESLQKVFSREIPQT